MTPIAAATGPPGGAPLVAAQQRWLEAALHADLGALRLHDDRAAHGETAAAGALALTRSNHVLWSARAPAPGTDAGRELLMHEVVHALQQTAVRGPDGRWRVTDRGGGGNPQPAVDFAAELAGSAGFVSGAQIADVLAAYVATYPDDAEVLTIVAASQLAPTAPDAAEVRGLGVPAAALHVDLAKVTGHDRRAVELAATHGYALPTAIRSTSFYRAALGKDGAAIAVLARGVGATVLRPILTAVDRALLSPQADTATLFPVVVWSYPPLVDGQVAASELWIGLARAAHAASQALGDHVAGLVATQDENPTLDRVAVMQRAAAALAKEKKVPALVAEREGAAVLRVLWPDVRAIAKAAGALWRRAMNEVPGELARSQTRAEAVNTSLAERDLDDEVFAVVDRVLDLIDLRSTPATFESAIQTGIASLATSSEVLAAQLAAIDPDDRVGATADAIAQGMLVLARARLALAGYDDARDAKLDRYDDERVAVGVSLASTLQARARRFELASTSARIDDFFKTSRLAILGAWAEQSPKPGQLAQEMGDELQGQLRGSGLTWPLIEGALAATRDEELTQALELALASERPGRVRAAAIDAAQWPDRPRRFEAPALFWNVEPDRGDENGGARLVFDHWATGAQMRSIIGTAGGFGGVPSLAPGTMHDHVVLWVVPSADRLVERLKEVTSLAALVDDAWHGTGQPTSWEWLITMSDVMKAQPAHAAKGHTSRETLTAGIRAQLVAERRRARAQRLDAWRRASARDRSAVVDDVAEILSHYTGDRGDFPLIRKAFAQIRSFLETVEPVEDRPAHAAALALTLADDLVRAFGDSLDTHFEAVSHVSPLVTGAMTLWNDRVGNGGRKAILAVADGMSVDELEARAVRLAPLARGYDAYVTGIQMRNGFVAIADGDAPRLHNVRGEAGAIPKGHAFEISHVPYRLMEIHQSFIFHPAFRYDDAGARWGGAAVGPPLLTDLDGNPWSARGAPLLTYTRAGTSIVVTDRDLDALADIEDIVGLWFFVGTMEETGAAITWVFNRVLDLLELIPGIGQGITVARFAVAVLDFINKGELASVIEVIKHFSVERLIKELERRLDPVELLFALADGDLDVKHQPTVEPEVEAMSAKTGPFAKIAHAVRAMLTMGRRILEAVAGAQTTVGGAIHGLQDLVVANRGAAVVAALIEHFADRLGSATLDGHDGDLAGEVVAAAGDIVQGTVGIFDGLLGFALPAEILPLEVVVDFVVDRVVDSLGGKYELIAKGGRWLLTELGLWSEIEAAIADLIRDVGDPNELYRAAVDRFLTPLLDDARGAIARLVAAGLRELRAVPGLSTLADAAAPTESLAITFDHDDTFDAHRVDDALATPGGRVFTTGGVRLAPSARAWGEGLVGHDLGHVRVHRDAGADAATRAVGADGLTTGSHVLLRGDVGVDTSAGRQVVAHELAHVVQQTGARPRFTTHSDRALRGQPGRGLAIDWQREAEADAVARRADRGGPPLPLTAARGIQPSLGGFLKRFVSHLTTAGDIRERATKAERKVASATDQELGRRIVREVLEALGAATLTGTFSGVQEKIIRYLKGRRGELDVLGAEAVDEGRTWIGKKKNVSYLKPQVVDRRLTDLVFGLTGIGLELTMTTEAGTGAATKHKVLSEAHPVTAATVRYMYLPFVGATSTLWSDVMSASFSLTADEAPQYRAAVRKLLADPTQKVWDKTSYRFDDAFVAATKEEVKRAKADKETALPPDRLPSKKDYLETDPTKVTRDPVHGHIGLRLGTYADAKDGGTQQGTGRASHHLTQWLLLEYLAGLHEQKPLGFTPRNIPGLVAAGQRLESITSGGQTIDLKTPTEGHRGAAMPTFLISREAHVAHLHIGNHPDELEDSPAKDVNRAFNAAASKVGLDRMQAPPKRRETEFVAALFTAVRTTFATYQSDLDKRVKNNVPAPESEYYNRIAAEAEIQAKVETDSTPGAIEKKSDRITPAEVLDVCIKVVAHNRKQMQAWGLE